MLRKIVGYFTQPPPIPPMFLNGALYVSLAVVLFWQGQLASDEAGKFISLEVLWYLKLIVGSIGAALLAVKLFMSTNYSEHLVEKAKEEKAAEKKE